MKNVLYVAQLGENEYPQQPQLQQVEIRSSRQYLDHLEFGYLSFFTMIYSHCCMSYYYYHIALP